MVAQLIIHPSESSLRGSIPTPGDPDVALARMSLAALSRGRSTLAFRGEQGKIKAFLEFLALLGVRGSYADGAIEIQGVGLFGLQPSDQVLDVRGLADIAGLALGLLVSRPFRSALLVDDVVAELLVPALKEAHAIDVTAEASGGQRLDLLPRAEAERATGVSVIVQGVFPWIKRAILLAGLRSSGPTVVEERWASADHLERAMTRARMPIDVQGTVVVLHPPRDVDAVAPQVFESVGSTPFAAALLGAALTRAGSEVTLREVGTNPTRSDFYSVLRHMGAELAVAPLGDRQGEPFGNVSARSAHLRAVRIGGETAVRLGDEVLVLFALAARATGVSSFTDLVAEGRGGDSRIWARAAGVLSSAGVQVEFSEGRVSVTGTGGLPFAGFRTTTGGDSRLAVLSTLLALGASEKSIIDNVDCLAPDFPRWSGSLRALGVELEVVQV